MHDKIRRISAILGAALALTACATVEQDLQPGVDSLHAPEMDAAIKAAGPGSPRAPAPRT
jgi:hypothetical protein